MSRVIHFEIPASDPERAANFYKKAFGWKIEKWPGPMDYWMVTTGTDGAPGNQRRIAAQAGAHCGNNQHDRCGVRGRRRGRGAGRRRKVGCSENADSHDWLLRVL
jgi:catechol 2,3-dioxygenase-like lactoylglutathione lyase family enzyme